MSARRRTAKPVAPAVPRAPLAPAVTPARDDGFVLICLALAISGFAALTYQIVWMRQLALVFGTAQTAISAVLAAYMGGLALGGWLGGRMARLVRRPERSYAFLELLIAGSALVVPLLLIGAQALLPVLLGSSEALPPDAGIGQALFYLVAAAIILAVPTVAMGATLPLLIRAAAARDINRRIPMLYGANTAGAAFGALVAGFLLVPQLGLSGATLVAVAANLVVAALILKLAPTLAAAEHPPAGSAASPALYPLLLATAWIGMVAFVLEIFWSRLLSHLLGGTTQGFALMLGVWLAGIAIGGAAAAPLGRTAARARTALPMVLGAAGLLTAGAYLGLARFDPAQAAGLPLPLLIAAVMLPGTICLGASWPLVVAASDPTPQGAARAAGLIYAANTAGAILGSLLAAYVALPLLGFEGTVAAGSAALLLAALLLALPRHRLMAAGCGTAAATMVAIGLPRPDMMLSASAVDRAAPGTALFLAVGRAATVQVQGRPDGFSLRSDGLPEALVARRGAPPILNDQMWLTALPALARPQAPRMLVVGFGGGVALEAVPSWVQSIDVVEIEPRIVDANRTIAVLRSRDPLGEPRLRIVGNDARNALMRTTAGYDIIVSQPSHPWTQGSSSLYTREFADLARARLAPGGVFVQWMNAGFVDEALFRAFVATLVGRFRHVRLYEAVPMSFLFLASDEPIEPEAGFAAASPADRARLAVAGLVVPADLIWPLLADEAGLRRLAAGADPISDRRNDFAARPYPRDGGMDAAQVSAVFDAVDLARSTWPEPASAAYVATRLAAGRRRPAGGFAGGSRAADRDFAAAAAELAALARGGGSAEARAAVARLPAPAAAVITAWRLGAVNQPARIATLDTVLAQAQPTDPWYSTAARLRADWRLAAGDDAHVAEALAIVEAALAIGMTKDLLMQRAAAAYLLARPEVLLETAAAFAVETDARAAGTDLDRRRLAALKMMVKSLAVSPRRAEILAML